METFTQQNLRKRSQKRWEDDLVDRGLVSKNGPRSGLEGQPASDFGLIQPFVDLPGNLSTTLPHRLTMLRYLIVAVALCCLSGHYLLAQNRSGGEITGVVTDSSGAVVPLATVKIENQGTGVAINVQTSASGNYDAPFLPAGVYSETVAHVGFRTFQRRDITVDVGQTVRVDTSLIVGQTAEQVTVTGAEPEMQRESSQVELTLPSALVESLPMVNRDVSTAEILAPGFSMAQSQQGGASPISGWDPGRVSVQGSRAFSIDATLNGGTIILAQSDNFGSDIPALSAVSEFQMIQNNFSAEYGSGSSVETILMKSGSNRFHGSLFEYDKNDFLNATPGFASKKGATRYNQFGGTLGGPVLRNKLFFFFSYQNTLNPNRSGGVYTVPTKQMAAGDFSQFSKPIIDPATGLPFPGNQIPQNRFDSVAKNLLAYWPSPNYGAVGATSSNFFGLAKHSPKSPYYDENVEWNISPAHQLSFTGHNAFNLTPQPPLATDCYLIQNCGISGTYEYVYQLMERWIINPHTVNAAYATFVREHYWNFPSSLDKNLPATLGFPAGISPHVFPKFSISNGVSTSLGPETYSGGVQNVFTYSDVLSWTKGRHSFSAGGLFNKSQVNKPQVWGVPTFTFNGQYTGNGFADFLLGDVQQYQYKATLTEYGERHTSMAAFIQDDWKVLRNLTLNLGLRYQYEGGFSEHKMQDANFSPTLNNPLTNTPGAIVFANSSGWILQQDHRLLFAPRIGFAESIGQKTVVRGGFGLFNQMADAQRGANEGPPGFALNQTLVAQTPTTPSPFQLQDGPPAYVIPTAADRTGSIQNGQSISWWPYHSRQPYTEEWNVSVQRQLGSQMAATVSYVGSAGRHLFVNYDSNQVPLSQLGTPTDQTNPQSLRPFPQYLGISTNGYVASSGYNALEVSMQRRYSSGLAVIANYTWSKSLDDSSYDLTAGGDGGDYQDSYKLPKAVSAFDEEQRMVLAYVYDLPVGRGRRFVNHGGVLDNIIGGWKTAGNFTANSGFPFTIYAGGVNNTGALAGSLFADSVGNQPAAKDHSQWFNPANYAHPAAYMFGNSGRNSVRAPGDWYFDANLEKAFSVADFGTLKLRADAGNLFNHKNLNQPNNTLGTTATGTITSSTPARILEIGAQFSF
jgi:Carboxypeptidase regulatory-like domain